jgi:hypothetical protein
MIHPSAKKDGKSRVPGGQMSASYENKFVKAPVDQPRKAVAPRQDKAGPACSSQSTFFRGAARVWNKVRPRATRSG